jgi:hypothetical protein
LKEVEDFAGIHISSSLDTKSLPSDENHKLQELINDACFFEISPEEISPLGVMVDYFQYKIIIEEDGRKKVVEITEKNIQPNLKPLIRFLQDKALSLKK